MLVWRSGSERCWRFPIWSERRRPGDRPGVRMHHALGETSLGHRSRRAAAIDESPNDCIPGVRLILLFLLFVARRVAETRSSSLALNCLQILGKRVCRLSLLRAGNLVRAPKATCVPLAQRTEDLRHQWRCPHARLACALKFCAKRMEAKSMIGVFGDHP
jgi:hypothetical protein